MKDDKWMQDTSKKIKKGALHRQLKVPLDKKIPLEKMNKAKTKAQKNLKTTHSSAAKTKDRRTIQRVTLANNFRKASSRKK